MNFLLDVSSVDIAKPIDNFMDKFLYGGQMLLIGMATVFSVLIILWLALVLFKFFFHDLPSRPKKIKEDAVEPAPVQQDAEAADGEEIIAVIAAAIAMAENECGGNKQFRVVSFKRK